MNRRKFMRSALVASMGTMAAVSGNPFSARIKLAQAAEGKTLVVVFQRGGCDGLNTCVPYGEERYYELRPTIAIAPPSASDPASAIDLDGFFGLHPALSAFAPLYSSGALAIMPAVHYPNASRSHFDSQQYIESAERSRDVDGWLNRYFQTTSGTGPIRGVSFGSELAQSLRGEVTVSSISDLNSFSLGVTEDEESRLLGNLSEVYDELSADGRSYRRLLNRFGSHLISDIENLRDIDASSYEPENGAVYPNNSSARRLRQIAQLIKSGVGLEAATVDFGGWDNHSNQGGGQEGGVHYNSLKRFGDSIAAFYQDMGSRMEDVVLLTCTEFGRTSAENGSLGTDHGWASTWFAMGGGVQGGILGSWPGLNVDQLHNGRYLEHSVDYRDIFAEILSQHMVASNTSTILPNHTTSSVGLFG